MLGQDGKVRFGVCWMLTAPDRSSDGNRRAYLLQPAVHRQFDPGLFDNLASLDDEPHGTRLLRIEDAGTIPGAIYSNGHLSDSTKDRMAFWIAARRALAEADIVFLDPDNGLDVPSVQPGQRNSSKYVTLQEVRSFYAAGKPVLIYQHYPRQKRSQFLEQCGDRLSEAMPDARLWAFQTKLTVFLMAIRPEQQSTLGPAARAVSERWDDDFIRAVDLNATYADQSRFR
ncbi:MAG: hypothetical protein RIE24_09630 [Silicimonas sp.]|jgi:hypothetical protein